MPRLETLGEVVRTRLQLYPCTEFETTPWVPLSKDLSECKMALVSTAGLHLRGDKPFLIETEGKDASYRVIPSSASTADITQSHESIGFDRAAFYRDMNIAFPIDRARELVQRGVIGSLSQNYYSFMGGLRDPRLLIEETGPQVAQRLKEEEVDLVFLVPI